MIQTNTMIIGFGITIIFALWFLNIFDMDLTGPGSFFKIFIIAFLIVYWRMGPFIIKDTKFYVFGGFIILFFATLCKNFLEK